MLYAAYGSNLHPIRVQQRTPSAQLLGTAAIAHQSLNFHKRGYTDFSGKCNIMPCHSSTVYIAVYDIPLAEMTVLDRHEGAGSGYDRAVISVDGFGNCVTYIAATAHIDEALSPFSWYKTLVLVGCERLAFPNSYVEAIRAVPAVKDFEGDRHQANMQLVEACKNAFFRTPRWMQLKVTVKMLEALKTRMGSWPVYRLSGCINGETATFNYTPPR